MTTPLKFAFCLTCLFFGKTALADNLKQSAPVQQKSGFISRNVDGATVSVKGAGLNVTALVHQSVSETIQPGGSVSLNCSVHTGSCDGEHSVYWFKDSGQSHPRLIYTNEDRHSQCQQKPETHSRTCVYSLPLKNLTRSHAGTYYCALVSCGHILFGNGTMLDFADDVSSPVLVYVLSGAVAFTILLCVLLAFIVCIINNTKCCQCSESQARFTSASTRNTEYTQNADSLHYAALSINLPERSVRQRDNTKTDFTTILAVSLTFTLCRTIKSNNCQCKESQVRFSDHPTTNSEVDQDSDNVQYVALSVNLPKRSRRQKSDTKSECVYSSMKL
ncbi:hypothetical protein Q5P01_002251 [Channa striata]|uniref:Ig-like domain-containing protein n=1 Tax=Channa striata TaxID=64152 RepID=A0AA88P0C7_CHASR|nr:hypothetical protein Q5P01_002251 [Channa striata]